MPSRNVIKIYVEDGYYHVYNRGVEKRDIFLDDQDYSVFLSFMKYYLSPSSPQSDLLLFDPKKRIRVKKKYCDEVSLLAFCLMPNHFHLLLKQIKKNSMTEFMRSLSTSYSMYFNKKYERVGSLFQGIYKAAFVDNNEYLLHLSKYIHLNPKEMLTGLNPSTSGVLKIEDYPYSSYPYYLERKSSDWVNAKEILSSFNNGNNSYQAFMEFEDIPEYLTSLALE